MRQDGLGYQTRRKTDKICQQDTETTIRTGKEGR